LFASQIQFAWIEQQGKSRDTGEIRGFRVRIVVALDEPDLIVTIHGLLR
jgi:hypothetical protein